MFVDMTFAEEPFFICTGLDDILEEGMDLKPLENIDIKAVLKGCRRLVGNDIIDGITIFREIVDAFDDLVVCRLFTFPPALAVAAEFNVLTVTAAEGEYPYVFDVVDLSAHEMNKVRGYNTGFSAVPFAYGKAFEDVEILVTAVEEGDSVWL